MMHWRATPAKAADPLAWYALWPGSMMRSLVIPANAGIHRWTPAFAGVTKDTR